MPLNRPALSLGPSPRSVREARQWVIEVFSVMGRDDLVECAALGASELVTNALLHARAPVQVQVRGTVDHPRVEVRDSSTRPPTFPNQVDQSSVGAISGLGPAGLPDDLGDVLLTFGRGLDMVARAAEAWGAVVESSGKTVWFEPAAALNEEGGPLGVLTGPEPSIDMDLAAAQSATRSIELIGVPVEDHLSFQRHYRELRRELRLLALAHESDYPLAKSLSELFDSLDGPLRRDLGIDQLEHARRHGHSHLDLSVSISPERIERLGTTSEVLDLADGFCREQRLLVLSRSPEQVAFQRWLLGQYVDQGAGLDAQPWDGSSAAADSEIRHTSVS